VIESKRLRSSVCAALAGALAVLFLSAPTFAQAGPDLETLAREIEILKQGQAAILQQLQELRGLLVGRQPPAGPAATPPSVILGVADARFKGAKDAPVTVIEYFDYQCPFCARHVRQTLPQIDRDFIATGKAKYVLRDFPIESLHPQAFKGHEASRCAAEQGKLWEMHERLIANQRAMAPDNLFEHADALGLNAAQFRQCLEAGKHAAAVRADMAEAGRLGISGTPTFLIARTVDEGARAQVVGLIRGAQPYERFKEAIETVLRDIAKAAGARQR
jgi:protein-disulfide isomerase